MSDQTLQEIKDRLDISEVIGGYIQLKKAGINYKAVCPFHNEKTASLIVSPSKQIWHCFGCGEGGDIFSFVKKFENLEFRETLKILADKAGVELKVFRARDQKEEDEKSLLLRINDFAARLYNTVLLKEEKGKEAFDYLKGRGLNLETIKKWQIGFSPDSFHFLRNALLKKGLTENLAIKAGVCVKGDRGNVYDRFRARITFPIFNYFGEVVGFSARILNDDGKLAKYINSPETTVYSKSRELFGLYFAKDAIRKKDEAVVVEGQMDCISAHQAGFLNTVASSGTALSESQLKEKFNSAKSQNLSQLVRLTKNLKFCFDADSAGQSATRRAGETAIKQGFRVKLIILKAVKDPDELIKKSPKLWENAVSRAVWFLDYYINAAKEKFEDDPVAQKHYLTEKVVPLVRFIQDPLEKDHYINELKQKFEISEQVIRGQTKSALQQPRNILINKPNSRKPFLVLEKLILGGVIKYPDFLKLILEHSEAKDFEDFEIGKLMGAILEQKNLSVLNLNSVLAKEALFMVESRLDELDGEEEFFKKELKKIFITLRINGLKKYQHRLSSDIKRAENLKDQIELKKLQKEFAEISSLKFNLEKEL